MAYDSTGFYQAPSQMKCQDTDDFPRLFYDIRHPCVDQSLAHSSYVNWDAIGTMSPISETATLTAMHELGISPSPMVSYTATTMHDLLSATEVPLFNAYGDGNVPPSTCGETGYVGFMPLIVRDGELVFQELGELPSLEGLVDSINPQFLGLESTGITSARYSDIDEEDIFDDSDTDTDFSFADISGNELAGLGESDDEFEEVINTEIANAVQYAALKQVAFSTEMEECFEVDPAQGAELRVVSDSSVDVDELGYPEFDEDGGGEADAEGETDNEECEYQQVLSIHDLKRRALEHAVDERVAKGGSLNGGDHGFRRCASRDATSYECRTYDGDVLEEIEHEERRGGDGDVIEEIEHDELRGDDGDVINSDEEDELNSDGENSLEGDEDDGLEIEELDSGEDCGLVMDEVDELDNSDVDGLKRDHADQFEIYEEYDLEIEVDQLRRGDVVQFSIYEAHELEVDELDELENDDDEDLKGNRDGVAEGSQLDRDREVIYEVTREDEFEKNEPKSNAGTILEDDDRIEFDGNGVGKFFECNRDDIRGVDASTLGNTVQRELVRHDTAISNDTQSEVIGDGTTYQLGIYDGMEVKENVKRTAEGNGMRGLEVAEIHELEGDGLREVHSSNDQDLEDGEIRDVEGGNTCELEDGEIPEFQGGLTSESGRSAFRIIENGTVIELVNAEVCLLEDGACGERNQEQLEDVKICAILDAVELAVAEIGPSEHGGMSSLPNDEAKLGTGDVEDETYAVDGDNELLKKPFYDFTNADVSSSSEGVNIDDSTAKGVKSRVFRDVIPSVVSGLDIFGVTEFCQVDQVAHEHANSSGLPPKATIEARRLEVYTSLDGVDAGLNNSGNEGSSDGEDSDEGDSDGEDSDDEYASEDILSDEEMSEDDEPDFITGCYPLLPDEDFVVPDEMWTEAVNQMKRAYDEQQFDGDERVRKRAKSTPLIHTDIYEAENFVSAVTPSGFFQSHLLDDLPLSTSPEHYHSICVEPR